MPRPLVILLTLLAASLAPLTPLTPFALADGLVMPPADYEGSFAERAQEAILIQRPGDGKTSSRQDMILKITVEGDAASFGWIIPMPSEPKVAKEDAKLFEELHDYVQARLTAQRAPKAAMEEGVDAAVGSVAPAPAPVEVLQRKHVGSFDVAVVREREAGALNDWLKKEGFKMLQGDDAEDLVGWYRERGYVFACVKVLDVQADGGAAELHPLRFTFDTGGRDGIYFPMRLTGLQSQPFDVNLYVFRPSWINDRLNAYGFKHRGFDLRWRDYDSRLCKPNAGKTWSDPDDDPYLRGYAHDLPNVTTLFQKLHPGRRFYLTNLYARNLQPDHVRDWSDDLWLFPYYTNRSVVPYDARDGGVAAAAYE